jgi:hypothetical protein
MILHQGPKILRQAAIRTGSIWRVQGGQEVDVLGSTTNWVLNLKNQNSWWPEFWNCNPLWKTNSMVCSLLHTSCKFEFNYLMHAKYMHELCSLLMHIPTYYNVISSYNHVL